MSPVFTHISPLGHCSPPISQQAHVVRDESKLHWQPVSCLLIQNANSRSPVILLLLLITYGIDVKLSKILHLKNHFHAFYNSRIGSRKFVSYSLLMLTAVHASKLLNNWYHYRLEYFDVFKINLQVLLLNMHFVHISALDVFMPPKGAVGSFWLASVGGNVDFLVATSVGNVVVAAGGAVDACGTSVTGIWEPDGNTDCRFIISGSLIVVEATDWTEIRCILLVNSKTLKILKITYYISLQNVFVQVYTWYIKVWKESNAEEKCRLCICACRRVCVCVCVCVCVFYS